MVMSRRRYRTTSISFNGIRQESNGYSYLSMFEHPERLGLEEKHPDIEEVRVLTKQDGRLYLKAIERRKWRYEKVEGRYVHHYKVISRKDINPPQLLNA